MATTYHLLPKNTPRNTLDPLLETLKFLNSLNQQVYGRWTKDKRQQGGAGLARQHSPNASSFGFVMQARAGYMECKYWIFVSVFDLGSWWQSIYTDWLSSINTLHYKPEREQETKTDHPPMTLYFICSEGRGKEKEKLMTAFGCYMSSNPT